LRKRAGFSATTPYILAAQIETIGRLHAKFDRELHA
jgi:hypothetical protein